MSFPVASVGMSPAETGTKRTNTEKYCEVLEGPTT